MHEKTSVPALINEITFLKQADAVELERIFSALDQAREAGNKKKEKSLIEQIDNFETHVVPIIADIDAGFGNEEATSLAKQMIEAGACLIQLENQVSEVKQWSSSGQGYRSPRGFSRENQCCALRLS